MAYQTLQAPSDIKSVQYVDQKSQSWQNVGNKLNPEIMLGDSIDPFATALGRKQGTTSLLVFLQGFAAQPNDRGLAQSGRRFA